MLNNLTSNTATATKRARFILITLSFALIGCTGAVNAQQKGSSASSSSTRNGQTDAGTVFRSARDLITDGEWAKAQAKFDEYVSSYPNEKNIDAALYWLAYTQQKLARYDQCRTTLERLLEKYPSSAWRDDARVLLAQVPTYTANYAAAVAASDELVAKLKLESVELPRFEGAYVIGSSTPQAPVAIATGQGAQGLATTVWTPEASSNSADDDDPCEFKIVVLQALFQTDLQRGIMAATEWLKPGSTQTVRCKSAALTLLGRNGGKTVTPVILGVARSEPDLKLRARAISTLGATNDDSVVDALRDFALNSQENDIVEASLYALSKHSGERAIVVLSDIAISGKATTQRKLAISSIATRPGEPAVDALLRIYDADQTVEIRRAVISGFGNRKSERAGAKLFDIARSSDTIELRKAAISAISRRGGEKAIEFLLSLYDTEKNEELRDQIMSALGYGSNVYVTGSGQGISYGVGSSSRMNDQRVIQKLIEIARDQKAPMERRKRAIGWLSRSKDPAVLKFLEDLLK
ncbi:MAG TPA: HEAT repeat domain-containing protein [Pyrinomonadaceae bacterium]|jgi:tetratricopeptide (TPR) repeat protein|nr:HEAT repeat domain-containing protein [Pyrinomonadaceae bacterium]